MHRLLAAIALPPAIAVASAVVATGCATGSTGTARPAQPSQPGASYYVALGDSLAQGVEADPAGASVETRHGYADQLYAALRRRDPALRLVKLGCPGETTGSMIFGRHCPYRAGSQLAAATGFLRAHPGHVSLITIDIGANDPDSCFTLPIPGQVPPCAGGPDRSTAAHLATIMARLRTAAGSRVAMIGMSYYDPELAGWRGGRSQHQFARISERAARAFDEMLGRVYAAFGARVANVSGAFHTANFGDRGRASQNRASQNRASQNSASHSSASHSSASQNGASRWRGLPLNAASVCRWTWVCAPPPRGPNKHPNTAGYAVIARAFLAADRQLVPARP